MTKLEIALGSKTFWLAVGAAVASALQALVPYLNGPVLSVVRDVLMVLTLFTAPAEIQKAGRAGARQGSY